MEWRLKIKLLPPVLDSLKSLLKVLGEYKLILLAEGKGFETDCSVLNILGRSAKPFYRLERKFVSKYSG